MRDILKWKGRSVNIKQKNNNQGGIYLVESVEDVNNLKVKNPAFLAFVTQTTLSMDDTSEVIDALRKNFPRLSSQKKDIVMPRKIGKTL